MRKIALMAASAALIVTGCTNDGLVNEPTGSEKALTFRGVMEKGVDTKASVIENTSELTSFFVHAGMSEELPTNNQPTYNASLTFLEAAVYKESSTWTYAPVRYWSSLRKYRFYAYAPIKDFNMTGDLTGNSSLSSVAFDYTVPSDQSGRVTANTAVDLLVSSALDLNYEANGNNNTVAFNFRHALSAANFSAINYLEGITFTVTDIAITGLSNQGTYTYNNTFANEEMDWTDAETTFQAGSWGTLEGSDVYYAGVPQAGVAVPYGSPGSNSYKLLSTNDLLMVLPQEVSITNDVSAAQVVIKYTAKYADGVNVGDDGEISTTLNFKDSGNSKFEFKQGIRYNFLIAFGYNDGEGPGEGPGSDLSKVSLSVTSVTDWKNEEPDLTGHVLPTDNN